MTFVSFSCLIAAAKISHTALNRSMSEDFPGGPVLKTMVPLQGVQV